MQSAEGISAKATQQKSHAASVAKVCRLIEAAETAPKLDALAACVGMSPHYFHRKFKAITGLTPRAYAAAFRAQKVRSELAGTRTRVTDAIYGAGFSSSGRFYEQSNAMLGMTPTDFRRGGANAEIYFAVGQCSLGAILVASSDKGVCAIALDDDPETLVKHLQDLFPKATLIGADSGFEKLVAQVVGFVETPQLGLDLPLDIRGAAFQQRVWQALRDIPSGSTASYADIAQRIGQPKAVRAVANACAANKLALAIPCHRVIHKDGSLSGYRWGVERKRALLDRESAALAARSSQSEESDPQPRTTPSRTK